MLCAIHQPNFFPWLGYFNKIARVDAFVFLNQVDYGKSGKSMQCYTNRVAILNGNRCEWFHCPVIREHGPQPIHTVKINNIIDWRTDRIKKLECNYKKAPYYNEVSNFIFDLINIEEEYLSEYNMKIIVELLKKLNIKTDIYRQDQIVTTAHSTELLVEIINKINGNAYLYGGGGNKYQEEEIFINNNIAIYPQNFQSPIYNQMNEEFVGGLSIIDALFFLGFSKTRQLIIE